jgi:predicted nucleic acid-binding protein
VSKYCIDAHALIWHLEDNPKLGGEAKRILNDANSRLILPAIALAEACRAVAGGRTAIDDWRKVIASVRADPRVVIAPLDVEVVERATSLTGALEMHDAQIVATALLSFEPAEDVILLTYD